MENRFIKVESTKILCDLTTANIRQPKAPRLGEVNGASRATENAVTTNTHPELNRHPAQELQPSYNPQVLGNWEKLSPVSGDGCENSKA